MQVLPIISTKNRRQQKIYATKNIGTDVLFSKKKYYSLVLLKFSFKLNVLLILIKNKKIKCCFLKIFSSHDNTPDNKQITV